ncbi:MAG TPA: tyrosine-type recombinase/integrase [Sideroxyarcus sp.]|nr:tyrosine-type recombinase/integrase [Sideroxyarcus sp.]
MLNESQTGNVQSKPKREKITTDTQCRNAKPEGAPYRCPVEKGLYFEVKPNGVKTWLYRFETVVNGKRKESIFTIGNYGRAPAAETAEQAIARQSSGVFTLAEARAERVKARALVKQGISPVRNRKTVQLKAQFAATDIFEQLAKEWLTLKDWEEVTKKRRRDMLERVVFPYIGQLPLRQIASAHILEVLTKAAKNNGPSVMKEAKRTLFGIFELAVETERVESNPVRQWRGVLPANKTQHKEALSKEDIGKLMRDIAGYERNFQTVGALLLMWYTLCRSNEVIGARWCEIDLEHATWLIPAERMKKRKEHKVPLPRQAVALLRRIKEVSGHREHVFPNRDNRDIPMASATLRQALNYLGWGTKFSPHATRTTGSTRLHEMGYNSDWIERQLAHADQNNVRRTYNHANYFDDRAKMMQRWADFLDEVREGAKVLSLKAA